MAKPVGLSVCDKLLLAAYGLEASGRSPFTAEDLVVAAWQRFPSAFGLSGYLDAQGKPAYPDSNRVFAEVMGSKPIRKRGLLVKVGRKMYSLTESGRDLAARLSPDAGHDQGSDVQGGKLGVGRDVRAEIVRLLSSRAVSKVKEGRTDALTFHDACLFWGINPATSAIELQGKLANVQGTLDAAERELTAGARHLKHGGEAITGDRLGLLQRTHQALLAAFEDEIKTIRLRTDQRRS